MQTYLQYFISLKTTHNFGYGQFLSKFKYYFNLRIKSEKMC